MFKKFLFLLLFLLITSTGCLPQNQTPITNTTQMTPSTPIIEQGWDDPEQTYNLKLNQQTIANIENFSLNIKLVEINPFSQLPELELYNYNKITPDCDIEQKTCKEKLYYYKLEIENIDLKNCGKKEIYISSIITQSYECPSFIEFIVLPEKSTEQEVYFKIDYLEVAPL